MELIQATIKEQMNTSRKCGLHNRTLFSFKKKEKKRTGAIVAQQVQVIMWDTYIPYQSANSNLGSSVSKLTSY